MIATEATDAPYVLERLSEEEAYFHAIMTDPSGLDQAEFLFENLACEDHLKKIDGLMVQVRPAPSNCFRAWDFQVGWWRCQDQFQIDQFARSLGKSESIKVRACAHPWVNPGAEMVVTAPELIHLEPVASKIEGQFYRTWLLEQLLPRGRSAVTHRPFQMNFLNGATIVGRIPQRDGRGCKGLHPKWLEQDEAQDYPGPGWNELNETLKKGTPGSIWRAHGVTRGVRDDFYEKTQPDPDNPWRVHHCQAMARPNFTDQERRDAIAQYGSRDDPDYRRNVLGEHGDSTNPVFNLATLSQCWDDDPTSDYNANEYYFQSIKAEELERRKVNILQMIDLPPAHLSYVGSPAEVAAQRSGKAQKPPKAFFWVGMDVGLTQDPTEILIWVQYRPNPKDPLPRLRLLTRISLIRMPPMQQLAAMLYVIDHYDPRVFAIDKNGIGHPIWKIVQEFLDAYERSKADPSAMDEIPAWLHGFNLQNAVTKIKGYSFGEVLVIDIDRSIEVGKYEDAVEKAGMKREAKTYGTDILRGLVDRQQLELPWDTEFLKQFQGATWTQVKGGTDQYGRRQYNKANDHCLDASREMALGWAQYSIEEMLTKPKHKPVLDTFMDFG